MTAALLEDRAEAKQAKAIDQLVVMTFDNGKTLILELDEHEDPGEYKSSVYYMGKVRIVKRMVVGRVRRIQIEI